jgi:SAM-dependent methyltransferase
MDLTPASNVDVNSEYMLHYCRQCPDWKTLRFLDYGCGNGHMVRFLRSQGIDAYGVDLPSSIAAYTESQASLVKDNFVKPLTTEGEIPFPFLFDVIISNQVLEHVDNLALVLASMKKALKPKGWMYHHFPCQETIREGHIGIPFAHWLPKGKLRFFYTYGLRLFGMGFHKNGHASRYAWTVYKLTWIDTLCHYRDFFEIVQVAESVGCHVFSQEMAYIRFRCRNKPLFRWMLKLAFFEPLYATLFRRLAFRVAHMTVR